MNDIEQAALRERFQKAQRHPTLVKPCPGRGQLRWNEAYNPLVLDLQDFHRKV